VTRLRRLLVAAIAVVMFVDVATAVLSHLDTPVRTPVGGAGVGEGTFPVALVAGVHSTGEGFANLVAALRARGVPVLDFDAVRPGIQAFTFTPRGPDDHVPALAVELLEPAIKAALARGGFDPERQLVDVVAHSYGGLLVRFLVERANWAPRVDDLVMVGTPNHGTELGFRQATLPPGRDEWDGVGGDLRPGSALLHAMGTSEPPGEVYTTIGGDPVALRWLRYGHHGFDGAVPAESPFLDGAANNTFPQTHGKLVSAAGPVRLIVATLAAHR
jgi:hypothetical protein